MQEQAECRDERAHVRNGDGSGKRAPRGTDAGRAIGARDDIPVRRHGALPMFDDEPVWEQVEPDRQRTIADSGGAAVLLVAIVTAAVVGLLLYFH